MRAPLNRLAAVLVGMAAVIGSAPVPAGGAPVGAAGWWTSANPGLPSGPVPTVVPTAADDGLPTDVPPGGLEVEQLGGVVSYAAVAALPPAGAVVERLVVEIDTSAADVPGTALRICPLTSGAPFPDAAGGPIGSAPPYDCRRSVSGVQRGESISFDVGSLVEDGRLGVAILTAGTGRTVLRPPDAAALVLRGSPTTATTQPAAGPSGTPATSPETPPPLGGDPSLASPTAGPPGFADTTAPVVRAATDATVAGAPSAALGLQSSAPVLSPERPTRSGGPGTPALGFLLLLAGAGAVARRNHRSSASPPKTES